MPETIGESFVNQLKQYYQQKPAAEPAVNRGHRSRDFKGGRINRLRPLSKRKSMSFKVAPNTVLFVTTAGPIYTATINDYHLSVIVGLGVTVNLPLAIDARAGKIIEVKDATGGCAGPTPIIVTPAGADTIEGFPGAAVIIVPFTTYRIISDGIGNWEVI